MSKWNIPIIVKVMLSILLTLKTKLHLVSGVAN